MDCRLVRCESETEAPSDVWPYSRWCDDEAASGKTPLEEFVETEEFARLVGPRAKLKSEK